MKVRGLGNNDVDLPDLIAAQAASTVLRHLSVAPFPNQIIDPLIPPVPTRLSRLQAAQTSPQTGAVQLWRVRTDPTDLLESLDIIPTQGLPMTLILYPELLSMRVTGLKS